MFSRIPQTLTAPFGLLGDEAKLRFRSQPGGISKLATVRSIPESDSYWDQYVVLFDSPSDVYSLVTPNDIRRALFDAPENVATLIRVISARLFKLISDHTFPSSQGPSVASFASSIMKSRSTTSDRNTTKEVLNCLRVLQRVLPVIFEIDGETNLMEAEVLWRAVEVDVDEEPESEPAEQSQFVIEDEDDEDADSPKSPSPPPQAKPREKKQLPSLAEKLWSSLIDLMFCCGFTLPTKIQVDHHKINYVIWEKGIGSTSDPGPSQPFDSNKTEVLRLLLVLLSRQIYVPASALFNKPSLYTLHLVQKTPRRDILTILCSLLNTAMNSPYISNNSIGGMAGKLPYNHLVFKGEDPRSNLVSMCLQVLCAILDFQSGEARDVISGSGDSQSSSPTARTNAFRYFLAKLHRSQDFSFILDGVVGILAQEMASVNNVLPGARKSVPYVAETVLFFWKVLELNKKFRTFILESDKAMDVVQYLFCYTLEIKDKPHLHGLCRALSYIIQTLSAEPIFGQKLSSSIRIPLPTKWQVTGTSADFMVVAVYSIVATTSGALNSLYPALIISLSNAAPYLKNLTITASTRLIQLFTSFSNPLFLLSDESHPRLLFFMLEVFNAVILHHLSENPNLTYGILSAHKAFEDLGTFTLSRGLREIKRAQQLKEEQSRRGDSRPHNRESSENLPELSEEKPRQNEAEQTGSPRPSETQDGEPEVSVAPAQMPMSPTSEVSPAGRPDSTVSPKVKGKRKEERRSLSLDMNGSTERLALAGIGRNGFVPSQEWVASWQQGLPLDPVMLLISELLPKIQEIQASRAKAHTVTGIKDFLSSVSLTHVLPSPPPLAPRRFMWSDASIVWSTSLIWGEIYVKSTTPLGVWNSTNVKLFYVKHTQSQQRQITETVSHVVGGFLGRGHSESSPVRPRA